MALNVLLRRQKQPQVSDKDVMVIGGADIELGDGVIWSVFVVLLEVGSGLLPVAPLHIVKAFCAYSFNSRTTRRRHCWTVRMLMLVRRRPGQAPREGMPRDARSWRHLRCGYVGHQPGLERGATGGT